MNQLEIKMFSCSFNQQEFKGIHLHQTLLLGVAAFMIAIKFQENRSTRFNVDAYLDLVQHVFTREALLEMERVIMSTLKFSFNQPLSLYFLEKYSDELKVSIALAVFSDLLFFL